MSFIKDQQQLSNSLKNVFEAQGFTKFEFDFPNYDTTGGYSAHMISVSVKAFKNNKPQLFEIIVKKNKENDIVLNQEVLKLVYSTEMNLYSKIIPYYEKFAKERNAVTFDHIPRCYGTVCDEKNYILFLENLKPKGFRLNLLERLMDLEQARLVLTAYSNWNAINLACRDQEPEKFAEFEEMMSPKKASSICELFVCSMVKEIEAAIEIFKEKGCLKIVERLERLKERYPEMYRDCFANKDENCLVVRHADCWNNNFLFHYDHDQMKPDKAVIVDWQLSFIGSPLADVTQFIFYSCDQETIGKTDELLKYYYNAVSKRLKELGSDPEKCFPWSVCQSSFRKYAPLAVGGVPLNIRFRHKTDFEEEVNDETLSNNDGSFNVLCGSKIRDPVEYFETLKGIIEMCIERNFI